MNSTLNQALKTINFTSVTINGKIRKDWTTGKTIKGIRAGFFNDFIATDAWRVKNSEIADSIKNVMGEMGYHQTENNTFFMEFKKDEKVARFYCISYENNNQTVFWWVLS